MPGLLPSLHLFLPPFLLLASSALLQHERERRPSSFLPRKEKRKESDVEEKEYGRQGGREGEREGGGKLLQVFEWPSSLIGWLLCRSSPSPATVVAVPGEESGGPWVGGGGKKEGREENGGICRMQFVHQDKKDHKHVSPTPFPPSPLAAQGEVLPTPTTKRRRRRRRDEDAVAVAAPKNNEEEGGARKGREGGKGGREGREGGRGGGRDGKAVAGVAIVFEGGRGEVERKEGIWKKRRNRFKGRRRFVFRNVFLEILSCLHSLFIEFAFLFR